VLGESTVLETSGTVETEKTQRIRTARIHPAIGIARLGNSPQKFFVGPEIPGVYDFPKNGFRDEENRLKRQAARFRIFGYDEHDRMVGELSELEAQIEWSVHLKNTKAVGRIFAGVKNPDMPQRNSAWLKAGKPAGELILDPGVHSVSEFQREEELLCESFMGSKFEPVLQLGKLQYESGTGRLLVLGGHGRAGTPDPDAYPLEDIGPYDFANHDGWFDDISDGIVSAKVTLHGNRQLYVKPAWVIVGPPKFAPELQSVVTLYDTLYQVAVDRGLIPSPFSNPRFVPSFNRDIYPILRRASEMRWVFANSGVGHTFGVSPGSPNERLHIFRQFRVPSGHPKEPGTGTGRMPFAWSDLYQDPSINGTLTPTQYRMMQAWAQGDFSNDWNGRPRSLSFEITPAGLDRAALEACVGAAFYPGIEASWKLRDVFECTEPFRLDPLSLSPGDISQQMSLPWQTDFVDCAYEDPYVWWPAQRPIDVHVDERPVYFPWTRKFDQTPCDPEIEGTSARDQIQPREMVQDFHRLGHVLRSGDQFTESGRVEKWILPKFNERNFK
jgi:hypothetical protein